MPYCSECGVRKTKVNKNKVCNDCSAASAENGGVDESIEKDTENNDFWKRMDLMFDKKLESFEEKLNANIKEEVKKVTDPMKTQLTKLEKENKTLKAEMTALKASQKEEKERSDKIVKVLKEQQTNMARSDKNDRFKRLLLSGVPEGSVKINGKECGVDQEKIHEVLSTLQVGVVNLVGHRRVGSKDQGADQRPRYIILEFISSAERNKVRKACDKLKDNQDTKQFFLKADKTKKERDEYKRLYKIKEQLEKDEPNKKVEISYGKLLVDGIAVDKVETENDFLL